MLALEIFIGLLPFLLIAGFGGSILYALKMRKKEEKNENI